MLQHKLPGNVELLTDLFRTVLLCKYKLKFKMWILHCKTNAFTYCIVFISNAESTFCTFVSTISIRFLESVFRCCITRLCTLTHC